MLFIITMSLIWGGAIFLRKFLLKDCGKLLAGVLSIVIAVLGAGSHVFISAAINQSSGIETDGMGYVKTGFLVLIMSVYMVYTSLMGKYTKP